MCGYFCVVDELQSIEPFKYPPHNNADSLYYPHTSSVEHTQSQYSPHADIQTQYTTQNGDNSQPEGSSDSVTETSEDMATETHTDRIISSAEPSNNKSKIYWFMTAAEM